MPGPVIQRTGTYRLLGSLLLYVVKRDGEGMEEEFSALKRRHPFFLVIKTRATPWTGWKKRESEGEKERERKGQKEGGREGRGAESLETFQSKRWMQEGERVALMMHKLGGLMGRGRRWRYRLRKDRGKY